jgi:YesN/AraC family two-component response regulator
MARVLIVAGESVRIEAWRTALLDRAPVVSVAASGAEALRRSLEQPFDLVLIDPRLPDMHGLDVIRRLWQLQPGAAAMLAMGPPPMESAEIASFSANHGGDPPRGAPHGGVAAALALVAVRYREASCTTRAIARAVGISEEYLCRLVKTQTGRTLGSFVHHARVGEACRLLAGTSLTIKETALLVGYNGPGPLERHFRRLLRMTPLAFRRSRDRTPGRSISADDLSIEAAGLPLAASSPRR